MVKGQKSNTDSEFVKVKISNRPMMWLDSLHYRFQVVEFSEIPRGITFEEDSVSARHCTFGRPGGLYEGPVFLSNKSCTIYPILSQTSEYDSMGHTKTIQAVFLLEDLMKYADFDSLNVYCRGHFGYENQSQMYTTDLIKRIEVDPNWFLFEEDKSYPVATNEWHKKWRKDNFGQPHTRIWYLDKRRYCD